VPVEAASGDAERLGQRLDPDGIRPVGGQSPQALTAAYSSATTRLAMRA